MKDARPSQPGNLLRIALFAPGVGGKGVAVLPQALNQEEAVGSSNWVHLDVVEILRITGKAFLVDTEDHGELWLPTSQISEADNYEEGDVDLTLSITEWIAKQKGIET